MPESLLTVLKFCFLALLYLFLLRVVRAVWAEVTPPAATPAAGTGRSGRAAEPARSAAPAAAAPATPRGRAGRSGGGTRLVVIEPAGSRDTSYELAEELTLGRAPTCNIVVDDTFASQLHARVFRKEGKVFLEDLGSTNGTYLNRKKVGGTIALRPGDRVQLGKTVLELA